MSNPPAFCLACGYPLSHLPEPRCPECGRPFDPADPRTMSLARPLTPWQRRLLKPTSWPTVTFAVLAAILLAYLSGSPQLEPARGSVLLQEFTGGPGILRLWRLQARVLRPADILFFTSALLFAIFLLLFVPRQLARLLVPRPAFRTVNAGPKPRYRYLAITVATAVFTTCLVFGWQKRIGRRWVDCATYGPPVQLSPEQSAKVIGSVIADYPHPGNRAEVLKMLVEESGDQALPGLLRAVRSESDPYVLAQELRLISLFRDPATAPLLTRHLTNPSPLVRAAAADAIGILHHPTYQIPYSNRFWDGWVALDGSPQIDLAPARVPRAVVSHHLTADPLIAVDPSIQTTLLHMMTEGPTSQEREAAARALVIWPPDGYKLRLAEWGVWVDLGGHMALVKSVIDEIPPFVHQTGNPADGFYSYFLSFPIAVTKPIIHLTANVALAADVEVRIRQGRPWFAFPMPDDFSFEPVQGPGPAVVRITPPTRSSFYPSETDDLSNPNMGSFDARYGYPWLLPHHRLSRPDPRGNVSIAELGLQWQSLILCPQRASWMALPQVPDDPKFAWWSALREVPSSWVASRGESERFLYYDGPTRAHAPVQVQLEEKNKSVNFSPLSPQEPLPTVPDDSQDIFKPILPPPDRSIPQREGLYLDVRNGHLQGQHVPLEPGESVPLQADLPLKDAAVINELRRLLTTYGLTTPEADGLIAAWKTRFFQTEGRRFILRMSPEDYARQCPIAVRPTPTQVVRLGLILTEFDPPTTTPGTQP